LLATVGLIIIGMAGTISGPRYYGKTAWAVPDDLWATLIAAQRLLHLDLGGLYTPPTNLVSFPGAAVILVPLAVIMDVAGLPLRAGHQGTYPGEWLLVGPYAVAISAVALFAADAIAERLGASQPKRLLLASAGATALWNVTIRWGHPEDAVATGLLLYAVLALSGSRTSRAAWLAGAAVAIQPLVLLAFPVLAAAVEPRRLPGFVTRAAAPAVLSLAAVAAANWTPTISRVTSQPNAPAIDHPTPWIYLAPHMSDGSVAAGPARVLAIAAACGCALVVWRRWRAAQSARAPRAAQSARAARSARALRSARAAGAWSQEALQDLLWWTAVALALRSVFEPVMVAYYLWPPLAVALIAASRDWPHLVPTGCVVIVLTFFSQIWWRNPWSWWTPMITGLALTLFFARVKRGRPQRDTAAQVLPEPGEQFVADGAP
jgi:hypothetical protein